MRFNSRFCNLILAALLMMVCESSFAQLSNDDQWALDKVQKMLVDPVQRGTAIKETEGADAAHQNALNSVGSENIEELYAISSIIMADLTKKSNGDVIQMQALLSKAKSDPKAFFDSLSPAAINAIKKLAPKVKVRPS